MQTADREMVSGAVYD